MLKEKKLDSITNKKSEKKKVSQSKLKMIKSLAGKVEWIGDLSEVRQGRIFDDIV